MTTDAQGYNGWKNYETWAVNLHLSNDQDLYNTVLEVTREAQEDGNEIYRVADAIKLFVEDDFLEPVFENANDLAVSLMHGLLRGALSEVDWFEIAPHWIEAVNDQ